MRFIFLLIISALLAGCAGRREVGMTRLPHLDFYFGSLVPLSADAHIDKSVSKAEIEYLQKAVACDPVCGPATIDGIYKTKSHDGDILDVRRSNLFWRFKHTTAGQWQLLEHGDWYA